MYSKTLLFVFLGCMVVFAQPMPDSEESSTFEEKIQSSIDAVKDAASNIRDSLANVGNAIAQWWDKTQHPEKYEHFEKLQEEYEYLTNQYELHVHTKMEDWKNIVLEIQRVQEALESARLLKDNQEDELEKINVQYTEKLRVLEQKIKEAASNIKHKK